MKKILLTAVNAKFIHSNPAVRSLYLYASEFKENVEVCEYTINQDTDYILGELYLKKPDILCFSCYLWNIDVVRKLAGEFSKLMPACDIWLGGPEVSYSCEELLIQMPYVKGIMYGEGELVFYHMAGAYLSDGGNLNGIPGICYRKDGTIVREPPELPLDMDKLPFLYDNIEEYQHHIIYYESSRGCPFGCSYCMSSVDKGVRFRSLELVLMELQFFLDKSVPQVKFVDRTFNIDSRRTLQILNYLLEHDNGVTNFHFEVAADLITEQELSVMAKMRPGLIQLEIGVQSTNPNTLRAIHRNTDYLKLCHNVKRIQEKGNIHCHLDLIAGLPLEDYDSFVQSFNNVYELKPNQLQLGFLKVLKGAPMEREAAFYGIVWRSHTPYEVLYTDSISYEELLRLKGVEEMVEVYYNSGLFANTLRCMESCFKNGFAIYDALWQFYISRGQNFIKHTRISRYELLRAFYYEHIEKDRANLLDEVLLFDLYLKENLKTRPGFAMEQKEYKEKTTALYRKYGAQFRGIDFHIEMLNVDTALAGQGILKKRSCFLLFDYSRRNALTGNGTYMEVES